MTTQTATCYRIVIDRWHPYKLNRTRGRHWSVEQRLKRIDLNLIRLYARGIPLAGGKRSVRLIITLAPKQKAGDVDAYWKGLLDNLVELGLLIDDAHRWCQIEPVEFVRAESRCTTIELRDL